MLGDDTAVNGLAVRCRGPGVTGTSTEYREQKLGFSDSRWTDWSGACEVGSAVCAVKTRIEPDQGSWLSQDDAALTDVVMYCCKY